MKRSPNGAQRDVVVGRGQHARRQRVAAVGRRRREVGRDVEVEDAPEPARSARRARAGGTTPLFGVWRGKAAPSTCTRPPGNTTTSPPGERTYRRSEKPTVSVGPGDVDGLRVGGCGGGRPACRRVGGGFGGRVGLRFGPAPRRRPRSAGRFGRAASSSTSSGPLRASLAVLAPLASLAAARDAARRQHRQRCQRRNENEATDGERPNRHPAPGHCNVWAAARHSAAARFPWGLRSTSGPPATPAGRSTRWPASTRRWWRCARGGTGAARPRRATSCGRWRRSFPAACASSTRWGRDELARRAAAAAARGGGRAARAVDGLDRRAITR